MGKHWQTATLLAESALLLTLCNQEKPYPKHEAAELPAPPKNALLYYTASERKAVANGDGQLEGEAKVTFDARAH